ncbi:MAG: diaminopimelate decarboxylase [Prevotellaceae bacterium]|jgi:diaminopimelate decarboxylase|nr:diaminopimelate decarboxylase [Prevotellaceae bacterium]
MKFPIEKFKTIDTPFYYYDTDLLRRTLTEIKQQQNENFRVHYALKANANAAILKEIKDAGFGADCVSGGEIRAALAAGISADKIVFAGVGKADWEINLGLENDILCFNAESVPELEVINQLAAAQGKTASVALRINPNIDAHTHHYITTGLNENKFGINLVDIERVTDLLPTLKNLHFVGLHFHIGSQITDFAPFQGLCVRINEIQKYFQNKKLAVEYINVGGGLGIDYDKPNDNPIPDFETYFAVFKKHLPLTATQTLHFELGRAVVAQCGTLVSRVLYVKEGTAKNFVILDAGMTDLIRPALYNAHHHIENLSASNAAPQELYDVVGPICESSDCFAKAILLPHTQRGDLVALRSAGAYGEIMASQYNLRKLPQGVYSGELL